MLRVMTRRRSRMRQFCAHGYVQRARGSPRPYRDLIELLLSGSSLMFSLAITAVFI